MFEKNYIGTTDFLEVSEDTIRQDIEGYVKNIELALQELKDIGPQWIKLTHTARYRWLW